MTREVGLLALFCLAASAQEGWRHEVMGLPDRAGTNTSVARRESLARSAT